MFVTPPSEELSLLEDRRDESEEDLSNTTTASSLKVKSEQLVRTLVGRQLGGGECLPPRGRKPSVVLGVMCVQVLPLPSLGVLPEHPASASPSGTFPSSDFSYFPRGNRE